MSKIIKYNKDIAFATIPYIIVYVATMLLIGFGVLISADFEWSVFGTSMFWFTTGSTSIATILVFVARFLQKSQAKQKPKYVTIVENDIIREQELDTDFTKSEKIFSAFAEQDNHDLEDFLRLENLERKIDEWKGHISERIDKHLSKQKPNDYVALANKDITNKWVLKYNRLKEKLSDTWIATNIDEINIQYDIVTRSLITNGCLIPKNRRRKSRKDYVVVKKGQKVFRDIAPKYLLSFAFVIFMSAFILDAVKGDVANWTQFAFKLLVLAVNFAQGDDYANVFHKEVTMNNVQFRLEMIKKYKQWTLKKG
jgi:hypothetical protein